ncbi:MAG TPA: MerR family transcriptional regulator [Geopsychrobacteraceae bacterium]|nr:MerR family transcriptional regulator [Geopsychrobacteraceae bacterium]
MTADIPNKLYFKIGEVAAIVDVKTHVLRYWETEFRAFKPVKSNANQRLYRRKDIETALLIKDLLYRQGFTISGARKKIHQEGLQQAKLSQQKLDDHSMLLRLRADLLDIKHQLTERDSS